MTLKAFTVIERGRGKPDYTRDVSSSIERSGVRLKEEQTLKIHARNRTPYDSEYPLLGSSPLAPGDSVHLADAETLVDLPAILPAGYTVTLTAMAFTFNQDAQIIAYLDGLFAYCLGMVAGGSAVYFNKIVGISTALYDPSALNSHTLDVKLTNIGTADLYGTVEVNTLIEAVGTGPLRGATKEVQCPYCSYRQIESVHATVITCQSCGKKYIVYDLSGFRGTP